jgi:hypothetical protein
MSGYEVPINEELIDYRKMVKKENPNVMVYDIRLLPTAPILNGERQDTWPNSLEDFQSDEEFKKAVAKKAHEKGYNIKWKPEDAGTTDDDDKSYTFTGFFEEGGKRFMKFCQTSTPSEVATNCFAIAIGVIAAKTAFGLGGKSRRKHQKKSKRKLHKNKRTKKNNKRT